MAGKTEEERLAHDLIRTGRLVYYCKPDENGDLIIRRFRLKKEDRPGAPDYVELKLVGVPIELE